MLANVDSLIVKMNNGWVTNVDSLIVKMNNGWVTNVDGLIVEMNNGWVTNALLAFLFPSVPLPAVPTYKYIYQLSN